MLAVTTAGEARAQLGPDLVVPCGSTQILDPASARRFNSITLEAGAAQRVEGDLPLSIRASLGSGGGGAGVIQVHLREDAAVAILPRRTAVGADLTAPGADVLPPFPGL